MQVDPTSGTAQKHRAVGPQEFINTPLQQQKAINGMEPNGALDVM